MPTELLEEFEAYVAVGKYMIIPFMTPCSHYRLQGLTAVKKAWQTPPHSSKFIRHIFTYTSNVLFPIHIPAHFAASMRFARG
eukprot:6197235-Pleurochrysis_carterae.AAC.5